MQAYIAARVKNITTEVYSITADVRYSKTIVRSSKTFVSGFATSVSNTKTIVNNFASNVSICATRVNVFAANVNNIALSASKRVLILPGTTFGSSPVSAGALHFLYKKLYVVTYLKYMHSIYNPAFALISSIRSIGFFAARRRLSSIFISGVSYSIHRYSFSREFSFMCGQSLQAQLLVGGAGINVLPGLAFII